MTTATGEKPLAGPQPPARADTGQPVVEYLEPRRQGPRPPAGEPSLCVRVYSVRNQREIRDAIVRACDAWVSGGDQCCAEATSGANGVAVLRGRNFAGWRISPRSEGFQDVGNFEWSAITDDASRTVPAQFRAILTVSVQGFRPCTKVVVLDMPGAQTTVYLSED